MKKEGKKQALDRQATLCAPREVSTGKLHRVVGVTEGDTVSAVLDGVLGCSRDMQDVRGWSFLLNPCEW